MKQTRKERQGIRPTKHSSEYKEKNYEKLQRLGFELGFGLRLGLKEELVLAYMSLVVPYRSLLCFVRPQFLQCL